jgi:hypothetical protein
MNQTTRDFYVCRGRLKRLKRKSDVIIDKLLEMIDVKNLFDIKELRDNLKIQITSDRELSKLLTDTEKQIAASLSAN